MASGVLNTEFYGMTSTPSTGEVANWFEVHVGKLNTLLAAEFTGCCPEFDTMAQNIFQEMYLEHYNGLMARKALYDVSSAIGADFITIREGDSVVTRTNRNEVAKTYRGISKEHGDKVTELAALYKLWKVRPLQVIAPLVPVEPIESEDTIHEVEEIVFL
jgi:hypothetical protein